MCAFSILHCSSFTHTHILTHSLNHSLPPSQVLKLLYYLVAGTLAYFSAEEDVFSVQKEMKGCGNLGALESPLYLQEQSRVEDGESVGLLGMCVCMCVCVCKCTKYLLCMHACVYACINIHACVCVCRRRRRKRSRRPSLRRRRQFQPRCVTRAPAAHKPHYTVPLLVDSGECVCTMWRT
jgi:hypothetical protein